MSNEILGRTVRVGRSGFRVEWDRAPNVGDIFVDSLGDKVRFDEIGMAGLAYCTREKDGWKAGYRPEELTKVNDNE